MSRLSQRRQMYRRQLVEQWVRQNLPGIWEQLRHAANVMALAKIKEQKRGRPASGRGRS